MANPRRISQHSHSVTINNNNNPETPFQYQPATPLTSLKHFLKKPHAIPFLLSVFLFLTWLCLRLQHTASVDFASSVEVHGADDEPNHDWKWSKEEDMMANLVRFSSESVLSPIVKDRRGWMLDPVAIARDSGIRGGAASCFSMHVGEIRPGAMRGNHRHHTCNETFVIWGGKTYFRVENKQVTSKGYAEVIIGADEVAVAASPRGTAHALVNMDPINTTYFIGCQDSIVNYNGTMDFTVWKDL